jgi:ribosomal protein L24E
MYCSSKYLKYLKSMVVPRVIRWYYPYCKRKKSLQKQWTGKYHLEQQGE